MKKNKTFYTDPESGVQIVNGRDQLEAVFPDGTRAPALGTMAQIHWATEGEVDIIKQYDSDKRREYAEKDVEQLQDIYRLFFAERTADNAAQLNALFTHFCCEIPRYLAWVEMGRNA